ncbi:hypothetical protein VHEMI04620 [[Torrubiella] hemipterigena]|uniref:Uncharacterized protein n=1 Tax=[Torrubiella] hemipterigena TaxID=1531966 RepID=A0A0A1TEX6_9HYPO|nr:hypothetical protein VHEMI04620 [[Torrubiella] hemipterigena]
MPPTQATPATTTSSSPTHTTAMAANMDLERQPRSLHRSTDSETVTRGRKRDRSPTRPEIRSLRGDVESSTLRGRSRGRSRSRPAFRDASSSVRSPSRKRIEHNRPRDARREHCPSRTRSPSRHRALRRRQRTRSRTRASFAESDMRVPSIQVIEV